MGIPLIILRGLLLTIPLDSIFYANKNITTGGEGGALATNNNHLAKKVKKKHILLTFICCLTLISNLLFG